jgi:hypothetical protein
VGRDYSSKEAVLAVGPVLDFVRFTRSVKPMRSTGPSVGGAPENEILAGIDRPQRKSWVRDERLGRSLPEAVTQ